MLNKIRKIISILVEIIKLPKVFIAFKNSSDESLVWYKNTYNYFIKTHRLKLFKNKTIGVALIDLSLYKDFQEYYKTINGKNSAAYYYRKALKREYKFKETDRNHYIDDMYDINTSAKVRQGRKMSYSYLQKNHSYIGKSNYRYFGVVNNEDKLVSYCNIGFFGEFSVVVTLLGHKKYLNDGVMYLMMIEISRLMFEDYRKNGYKFIMYDTFFGATDGLKMFKRKLGYKSYKVKWIWEN